MKKKQINDLYIFLTLLIKWNQAINLVGPKNWVEIFRSLIVDSLYLKDFLLSLQLKTNPRTFDLGAGAGLPGIPLRIVWDAGEYYLIEVRNKRAVFMRNALNQLELLNTYVLGMRVQEVPQEFLPPDIVISRAFMPWPKLLPMVRNLIGVGQGSATLIVMAGSAPPGDKKLVPWRVKEVFSYQTSGDLPARSLRRKVQKNKRYFWALEFRSAPN